MRIGRAGTSVPWSRLFAELAVIVAGVLIALAANSWWERRHEQNHAGEYLERLLVDAQTTERRLRSKIDAETQRLEAVSSVISRALSGPWPKRFAGASHQLRLFRATSWGTLIALMQSGDLRLLRSDSIRFELIAFSALIHEIETGLRHTETLIWNSTERVAAGRARHSQSAARRGTNAGRPWTCFPAASLTTTGEAQHVTDTQGARDPSPHQTRLVSVAPNVQVEVLDWG
jgi:hypothetical protein